MEKILVNVDINSLISTKRLMNEKYIEIISLINKYKGIVENTTNIYDTESATLYRSIASNYIEILEKTINEDIRPYIATLDKVKQMYTDEYELISNAVHGGKQ